jgi:hypothetical protein
MKLCKSGNLSKAVKTLSAQTHGVRVAGTRDSFDKLVLKHPNAGPNPLTAEQCAIMASFNISNNDDIEIIEANEILIESIIRDFKNGVCHGLDHLRPEHLKQLFGSFDTNDNVRAFRNALTDFIQAIINADIPNDVQFIFRDYELVAIPKNDLDIRPIGLRNIYKKVAMSIVMRNNALKELNANIFGNAPICLSPRGTEAIAIMTFVGSAIIPLKRLYEISQRFFWICSRVPPK